MSMKNLNLQANEEDGQQISSFDKLIVLIYADNTCYTNVVPIEIAFRKHNSFYVDMSNMKWGYNEKEYLIGKSRYIERHQHYGVIGVYLKNSIEQLNSMVRHAQLALD